MRHVPFDVGRSILRTVEKHASLLLGTDKQVIITLPTFADDERPVFVLIQARANKNPLTSPVVPAVRPAARKRARTTTPRPLFP